MEGEGDEEEMVNGDRERDLGDEVTLSILVCCCATFSLTPEVISGYC